MAYTLREEGIKSPVGWGKSKYLTREVIEESILWCRAVLGERVHCGVVHKDTYPPIITPEQFDQVQAAIAKRRIKPTIAALIGRLWLYSKAFLTVHFVVFEWLLSERKGLYTRINGFTTHQK